MPQLLFWIVYGLIFMAAYVPARRSWHLASGFWDADHRITAWKTDARQRAVGRLIVRAAKLRNAHLTFLAIIVANGLTRIGIGAVWASDVVLLGAAAACVLLTRRIHRDVFRLHQSYRRIVGCTPSVILSSGAPYDASAQRTLSQ